MISSLRFSQGSQEGDIMSITVDQTLLDAVQRIAPVIRAHSQEAEHRGRFSKSALDALADAGFLRMLTPRALGGLEVDPLTCARVIEEVSRADSVAGWSLVNPLNYAWFCARLPDRGAEDIFRSNPNALIMPSLPGRFIRPCRQLRWQAVIASRGGRAWPATVTMLP